jgi:hypothetical protein
MAQSTFHCSFDLPPRIDCSTISPQSSKRTIPASASTTSTGTCRTWWVFSEIGKTGE